MVANHRYPSVVCAMARTESCGSPFEVVQTSWPNWVRASSDPSQAGTDNRPITSRLAGRSLTTLISAAAGKPLSAAGLYFTGAAMLPWWRPPPDSVLQMKLAYIRWKDA